MLVKRIVFLCDALVFFAFLFPRPESFNVFQVWGWKEGLFLCHETYQFVDAIACSSHKACFYYLFCKRFLWRDTVCGCVYRGGWCFGVYLFCCFSEPCVSLCVDDDAVLSE